MIFNGISAKMLEIFRFVALAAVLSLLLLLLLSCKRAETRDSTTAGERVARVDAGVEAAAAEVLILRGVALLMALALFAAAAEDRGLLAAALLEDEVVLPFLEELVVPVLIKNESM